MSDPAAKQPGVITMFKPDGTEGQYQMLWARIPTFLDRYPPCDGWRHERTVVEAVALAPQLVALHLAAIQAGRSPKDLGLPPLPRGYVFTSKLIDPQGREVASGSATSQVFDLTAPGSKSHKDFEYAETAAFQRLAAAVGIGGEVLADDEMRSIAGMGGRFRENVVPFSPPALAADQAAAEDGIDVAASTVDIPLPESPEDALAGVGLAAPAEVVVDASGIDVAPAAPVTPSVSAPSTSPVQLAGGGRRASDAQILAALNRQITTLAGQAGVGATKATSVADARAVLADIKKLLTH